MAAKLHFASNSAIQQLYYTGPGVKGWKESNMDQSQITELANALIGEVLNARGHPKMKPRNPILIELIGKAHINLPNYLWNWRTSLKQRASCRFTLDVIQICQWLLRSRAAKYSL